MSFQKTPWGQIFQVCFGIGAVHIILWSVQVSLLFVNSYWTLGNENPEVQEVHWKKFVFILQLVLDLLYVLGNAVTSHEFFNDELPKMLFIICCSG